MNDRTKIVRDTMMFVWNVSVRECIMTIFDKDISNMPEYELVYLKKYIDVIRCNPAQLFAMLDYDKMNNLTNAAKEKYGDINGI